MPVAGIPRGGFPSPLKVAVFGFIAAYSIVHVTFLYNFFTSAHGNSGKIFHKYDPDHPDKLDVARRVYFTKASWMFILVFLQALGNGGANLLNLRFLDAMVLSTLVYACELVWLFPMSIYLALNCLGAGAMLVAWILEPMEGTKEKEK